MKLASLDDKIFFSQDKKSTLNEGSTQQRDETVRLGSASLSIYRWLTHAS